MCKAFDGKSVKTEIHFLVCLEMVLVRHRLLQSAWLQGYVQIKFGYPSFVSTRNTIGVWCISLTLSIDGKPSKGFQFKSQAGLPY